MKILLLTAGSRGDVEPFVALARIAEAKGHQVQLGVPDHSGVDADGLDTVSLHMDFAQLVSDQGVSPRAAAKSFRTVIRPAMGRLLSAAVQHIVTFAPDVVVYHPKVLSAPIAANRVGIPSVIVETVPSVTRTREFAAPYITTVNLGPLNRATYPAAPLVGLMFRSELDMALKILPKGRERRAGPRASMVPVSPQLLPRPHDWPVTVHLTGYWSGKPRPLGDDAELEDFMDGGKFVYAGFGSMKAGDARERGEIVLEAARRCGLRVLATTGWGGLDIPGTAGDGVLVRESVAHEHVLSRAAAAIHHGGAGTVHVVARAVSPLSWCLLSQTSRSGDIWFTAAASDRHRSRTGKLSADRLSDAIGEVENCRLYAAQVGIAFVRRTAQLPLFTFWRTWAADPGAARRSRQGRFSNDELRSRFVGKMVEQVRVLGLTLPDSEVRFNAETKKWEHGPLDWEEFKEVPASRGPCNVQRLEGRRQAHDDGAWVREAPPLMRQNRHVKRTEGICSMSPYGNP